MKSILDSIHCTPSRRPVKFVPGPQSRHYLGFDPAISREDRLVLFMELFAFYRLLADPAIVPAFSLAPYLPEELVEIRVVTDPRHPAYGQAGLYARRQILANTIVTPYAGLVEIFGTSCNSRTYTMGFGSISDDYALDAEFCGNYGRFANDPRGVEGLTANLSAESKFNNRGESFTALVARRQINEGEEILMSYGKAHSLGPSPWSGVRGEILTRRREGGVVPVPMLSGSTTDGGSGVEKGYRVMWECPQCGGWSALSSPSMARVECCVGCGTPRLSGAKMVALLNAPQANAGDAHAVAHGEDKRDTGNAAVGHPIAVAEPESPYQFPAGSGDAGRCPNPVDLSLEHVEQSWRERQSAALAILSSQSKGCTPSSSSSVVTADGGAGFSSSPPPAPSPPPPPPVKRSHKKKIANNAVASPLADSNVAATVQARQTPTSPSSPGSSSVASSPPQHLASGSANGPGSPFPHHHHHHTSYSAVPCDWPMNVPFLSWQVWDPSVPVAALEKHARFDSHEHVFLYSVDIKESENDDIGEDGEETEETARHSRPLSAGHSASSRSTLPGGEDAGPRQAGPGDETDARPTTTAKATTTPPPKGEVDKAATGPGEGTAAAAADAARARNGRQRRKRTRSDMWQKQGTDELSSVLLSWSSSGQHKGKTKLVKAEAAVNANDHSSSVKSGTSAPCRDGGTGPAPSDVMATETEVYVSPLPLLSRSLGFQRERERFILLHTCVYANTASSPGVASVSGREDEKAASSAASSFSSLPAVPGPLDTVQAALRRMGTRPFTGKSFHPGSTVAYVGGCIRPLRDVRCRPEHSPLVIPLIYLVPTALRRQLQQQRQQEQGEALDVQRNAGQPIAEGGGATVDNGLRDLLERLGQLCLVVTNDMMLCPVLAEAAYLDDADPPKAKRNDGGGAPTPESSCTPHQYRSRTRLEVPQWQEEANALLKACNIALVLTLDSLGSPHVAAVATKHISSFEPLLARVQ